MASNPAGDLYVASVVSDEVTSDHFIVRRSTDGGGTWTIVDEFDRGGISIPGINEPTGITVDAAGDVYYAGRGYVSGVATWTIRKGVEGTSFSTVDLASGDAMAIFAHPIAGIFAAGSRSLYGIPTWAIRRSTNGGVTWSEINRFQLQSGQVSRALGIGADGAGNLYVVGLSDTRKGSTTTRHWLVRKSTDGGATFSTIDDFVPSDSTSAVAHRIVASATGDLYVAGVASISGTTHWIVRKSVGAVGPWTTVDDIQNATPRCIAANASGNVFVGGDNGHGLVKKY